MAETYCGKTCAECVHKESLNCPGCKTGPGQQFGGDCELAGCCRNKGHETCGTCAYQGTCNKYSRRDLVPDDRRRKLVLAEKEKETLAKRASVLGRWLWILFWLFIPAEIASIMTNDTIVQLAPVLSVPGNILKIAANVGYGLILMIIASEEELYRRAGICALITAAVGILTTLLFGSEMPGWSLIITLPAAIVGIVGEYYEYTAHGNVLWGVDNELSDKWTKLWKWYIISFAAMFGSLFVMLLIPVLGVIALTVSVIAVLVVGILKLYYLYCTAKTFREFDPAK